MDSKTMTPERAKELAHLFLNLSEDDNIIDWKFESNVLWLKIEDGEDGMVEVFSIEGDFKGYSATPDIDDFKFLAS